MARKFVSGQKISKLPTRELNEAIDAVQQAELFGNRQDPRGLAGQFTISVRNDTDDDDFERFDAIGLEEVLIDPDDNEIGFVATMNLGGIVPTFNHVSRFAVCLEPIRPGRIGKALMYGLRPAKVDLTSLSHRFCQPVDGVKRLGSVDFGGARIIWPNAPTSLGEQFCYVLLTGNGQATTGEVIAGELVTPLAGATKPDGTTREPGSALLRVWSTDGDNRLEDQSQNRYDIIEVTPTDPADLPAGQSFVIEEDVRFRLIPEHPIQVVESTSRDGTYFVESVTWNPLAGVAGETTIKTTNAIAEVLDPNPPNNPIVDGVILIPGGDGRKESDRYEVVLNYSTQPGDIHAWCVASHDGVGYTVSRIDY